MIPDYQTLLRPVLGASANGEIEIAQVVEMLADQFKLSLGEREEIIPSGKQTTFANRVHWAKSYLKMAGLVEYTGRGRFVATEAGRLVLSTSDKIDRKYLFRFPSFRESQIRVRQSEQVDQGDVQVSESLITPDETIRIAYQRINEALAVEIVDRILAAPPKFFEEVIVDLFVAMGYGGTSEDPGRAIGRSGDDGVDGVIDQDPLGVDQIFVQAKRFQPENNVGPGAIREFFGALSLKRANKGIFVTTSNFSQAAKDTARDLGSRIVLIDGPQLARLMIRYNIGCRDEQVLHIKKIDEDFFDQS
jgi:restriction system protein